MKREAVASSNIAEVGYDAVARTLEVAFKNGGVYQYLEVPEAIYRAFRSASSLGSFLHANIRDKYRCVRLV